MNIASLIRKNIRDMAPYSSARDEFSGTASIFLDANENPKETGMNRYPDPYQQEIKARLAEIKGVNPEQIFLGNGSDEPIDLLIRLFCIPGKDAILAPDPSYGMYKVAAAVNDVEVVLVPLSEDFQLVANDVIDAATPSVKIIFLCSPNNPSGNLLDKQQVEKVLSAFNGIVVIDEAYIDFADDPGFLTSLSQYPNLVVLQTFSKAWGLAGLRVGMAFASPEIIRYLNKIKPPYNINSLSQNAVLEALENSAELRDSVAALKSGRVWLTERLSGMPQVDKIFPSDSNFLLVKLEDAKRLFDTLLASGIIVRDRTSVLHGEDCLRFTVGLDEENIGLIEAIKKFYT